MIGIISYLPNDKELRTTRIKNCKKQLEWLHKVFPKERPLVIAQNYTDIDKCTNFDVEYDLYETGIGSHKARNTILRKFYDSENSWLFLMDDDVINYDYYDADTFIADVYYNKYPTLSTDIILAMQPEMSPFKKLNLENDVKHTYYLSRSAATNCPNMMLLKHPDKEHEHYFDDSIDLLADDAIPDDNKFIVECIASGMKVHRADFWIKKSLDRDVSVIYSRQKDINYAQHSNLGKNLANFVKTTYDVDSVAEFNKRYNKAVPIRLKRSVVYEIPDNLLPKDSVKKNRLF